MPTITFNIARRDSLPDVRSGSIAFFDVAGQRVKFILQHGRDGKPVSLTHFASGLVFGDLNRGKTLFLTNQGLSPFKRRATAHEGAKGLIAETIRRHGAADVLKRINSAPVINH
jgi:hypothetical protein